MHQRSNGYPAQRSTTKAWTQSYSARTVRAEVRVVVRDAPDSEQCLSGAAPDCPVPLEDKASNGQKLPKPNGWVTWLAHRTVSGAPIDSSPTPTVGLVIGAINTPNHHHSRYPSFSDISLNARASAFNTRHNSIESKPLQVPIPLKAISD